MTDQAVRLLRSADLAAERATSLVRMGAAVALFVALQLVTADDGEIVYSRMILQQINSAEITMALLFAVGAVSYALLRTGRWSPALGYVTATADIAILLSNAAYNHASTGLAGDFLWVFPAVWVVPIVLAASAMRYRPGFQVYLTLLCGGGLLAVALSAGQLSISQRAATIQQVNLLLGPPPNILRLCMLVITGIILAFVAWRGRRLLLRAIDETSQRITLTRFLPSEIADILQDEAVDLRRGRRQDASVLFIDMRDSTALAEDMAPEALSAFITGFRSLITRTVREHGGLIDKFIGDGALILFGVPNRQPDDAARAIACAEALSAVVGRWSAERVARGEPGVEVGIGLHYGPVFFGVVGDPSRLEATVLGDTVNVAARLEEATKTYDAAIIVSGEVLDAAGLPRNDPRFRNLGCVQLRGLSRGVDLSGLGAPIRAGAAAALYAT